MHAGYSANKKSAITILVWPQFSTPQTVDASKCCKKTREAINFIHKKQGFTGIYDNQRGIAYLKFYASREIHILFPGMQEHLI